ncbi:MAG: ribonuclease HII [Dehalococcoidia bacterium]
MREPPTFIYEEDLWAQGADLVAGVDEVGRGPLAGPVVAGAVLLPPCCHFPWLARVRDSKALSAARRQELADRICQDAVAIGLGMVPHHLVDDVGIVEATRLAMLAALEELSAAPEFVLIDALSLPRCSLPHRPIIHGDGLSLSIACASIVAKVARDRIMLKADSRYSGYGFARNKGYATREHLEALVRLGPSPIHRRTFAPVRACLEYL